MNSTTRGFVQLGSGATAAKCTDGTVVSTSTLTPLVCNCPTYASDIAPCVCGATRDSSTTLTLSCANGGLDGSSLANVFSNVSAATRQLVDTINLDFNRLVQVPASALKQYPNFKSLSIASNQITAIGADDLNLPATFVLVDLSNNNISSVAPSGAFPRKLKLNHSSIY